MGTFLLDTNILLRASDAGSSDQALARTAFETLTAKGHSCVLTGQVVGEFFSVATRPLTANGFGWAVERGTSERLMWTERFGLLEETPEIYFYWMRLIETFKVSGRQIFDLRLLAIMQRHRTTHLLTFNTKDLPPLEGIHVVHPGRLAAI